ncbi:ribosomal RNA small subunit methyltransferase B [bacterium BMS3Abin07]|nr:ribosomal RNA small subunit methyltransferase B [bacterium BMS3Abin07]GBE32064.1 ribosomal RNA small subunit methyltransferase B [bacterium BMS3Bbin05]HDO21529.1 16S rRNA (cytosine(967)-C(5))-methyltransferase RsmB [Nitrospirota bacterium]HDZ88720.1 16S rRNA (cytosine(967)-C(5))-methyltransferase RsmB [Nitrospirota bacterium]
MDKNRLNALNIIYSIFNGGLKTKEAMSKVISDDMKYQDRSFIMELVYGCVRNKIYLEWILRHYLRDFSHTDKHTLYNLMMALYQITHMRIPEWAAVNEAVEIEKERKGVPSLVNGVLRRYLKNANGLKLPGLSEDPVKHIAINTSHPEWLIKKWARRFSMDEVIALAEANNKIPPLTLRVNTLKCSLPEVTDILKKRGIQFELSAYSPDGINLTNTPLYPVSDLIGNVFLQDEASQLISYLLDPLPNQVILDACAAPGGKATHIAQISGNKSSIEAIEINSKRLKDLEDNIRNLGTVAVKPVLGDILLFKPGHKFDRILLDAPCSALGVIRRNPDVKYRHNRTSIKKLAKRQLAMLRHVSGLLKKNGVLVYSVCSTEPEETVEIVKEFLNINGDFYIINNSEFMERFKLSISRLINDAGHFFTYPHIHNMDGFFAVRLSRR